MFRMSIEGNSKIKSGIVPFPETMEAILLSEDKISSDEMSRP